MAFDVFISYSHHDENIADKACAALEAAGIQCWIAPRNVIPGSDWGESIINAIEGAKAMVLIFSGHANDSPQIKREVERAVNKRISIIPVRIENVAPSGALEYFISTSHWLDAFTSPVEMHFPRLVEAAKANITAAARKIAIAEPVSSKIAQPDGPDGVETSSIRAVASIGDVHAAKAAEKSHSVRLQGWLIVVLISLGALTAAFALYRWTLPPSIAEWVTLPPGTRFVNRSPQPVPTFTQPDRSSERSIDIKPGQTVPPSGSDQLLARNKIRSEDWIRFPVGDSNKDAYVPEAAVVLLPGRQ